MHSKIASKPTRPIPIPSDPVSLRATSLASSAASLSSHQNNRNPEPMAKSKNSPSKSDQLRERVNSIQNSTAIAAIRIANKSQINSEQGIVDGYLENVILIWC